MCGIPVENTSGVAAVSGDLFGESEACGGCIQVTGSNGKSAILKVIDRYWNVNTKGIQIPNEAFALFGDLAAYSIGITYEWVNCPVSGGLQYMFDGGASEWYLALKVINSPVRINYISILVGSSWTKMQKRSDNVFYINPSQKLSTPLKIRVYSVEGTYVEDTISTIKAGQIVKGKKNFKESEINNDQQNQNTQQQQQQQNQNTNTQQQQQNQNTQQQQQQQQQNQNTQQQQQQQQQNQNTQQQQQQQNTNTQQQQQQQQQQQNTNTQQQQQQNQNTQQQQQQNTNTQQQQQQNTNNQQQQQNTNTQQQQNQNQNQNTNTQQQQNQNQNTNNQQQNQNTNTQQQTSQNQPSYSDVLNLSPSGALHIHNNKLYDSNNKLVQLRGVSTHGINWFPNYVNEALFSELKNTWKANVVRLAMYTAEYNGYCNGGNKDNLEKLIDDGVKYAKKVGMYAIIDWHILNDNDPNIHKSEAIAFFSKMAAKYKSESHVLYEICNEPNGVSWDKVKSYAESVIPSITQHNPEAVIIVGTPNWSQDIDKAAENKVSKGKNVMYSLHFYAATHGDWLLERFKKVSGQIPIFVTEFATCESNGNGNIDNDMAAKWMKALDDKKVSFVAWNMANKGEASSMVKENVGKYSGLSFNDLKPFGQWYYNLLRSYHGISAEKAQTQTNTNTNTNTNIETSTSQSLTDPKSTPKTPKANTSIKRLVIKERKLNDGSNYVQLRGISTHGISWFPEYVNYNMFKFLKEKWNVNLIRLAMYPHQYNGYLDGGNKKELENIIVNGVNYATDLGLYVIIDWHIHETNPASDTEAAKIFFEKMAKLFKDHTNVFYELCNEPTGTSWETIKKYALDVIPVIRKYNKNAIVIVGTNTWSQDVDEAATDKITEYDNVMYTLHFYAGTHFDNLMNKFLTAVDKIPIFVTEYGTTDASGNGGFNPENAEKWLQLLEKYKVPYANWSLCNKGESSALIKDSCWEKNKIDDSCRSQSGDWIFKRYTKN